MSCTNCGHEQAEVYCARCGEKQPDHHDATIGHFFHELVHEVFHLDSKLALTLRTLVTRPGELTADYFAGRKTRYIKPLRLFLTLFALQLVAYTVYKPVALYSMQNVAQFALTANAMKPYDEIAAKKHMTRDQLFEKIDEKWQHNLSLMQLLNILGAALVLKILYRGKRHFGEHLVFSSHYLSFSYLYALCLWPVYLLTGLSLGVLMIVLMVLSNIVMATYFTLAIRRYYAQSLEKSIAKGILGYLGIFVASALVMQIAAVTAVVQVARG